MSIQNIHAMHNLSLAYTKNTSKSLIKVGILAVQGAFLEHAIAIKKLGACAIEVRKKEDLEEIDALILPGGESTVMIKFLKEEGLFDAIKTCCDNNIPILATCAGLILLAKEIKSHPNQKSLAVMDIVVNRNAFGRQVESFMEELTITLPFCSCDKYNAENEGNKTTEESSKNKENTSLFPAIFIRAPQIVDITSDNVKIIAQKDGAILAVQQENRIACAFHPELSHDMLFHAWLVREAENYALNKVSL